MKIIVSCATFAERRKIIPAMLKSLERQTVKADDIYIYDNSTEAVDLTDLGKFYHLRNIKSPAYFLTVDDDILYPPTYIEDMVKAVDVNNCIVTHHGKQLVDIGTDYHKGTHIKHRCLHENNYDGYIDVPGTGCMAFKTDYFNPVNITESSKRLMGDVVFAYKACINNKKIKCLKHPYEYIKSIPNPYGFSCFKERINNCKEEMLLCDEIIRFKAQKTESKNIVILCPTYKRLGLISSLKNQLCKQSTIHNYTFVIYNDCPEDKHKIDLLKDKNVVVHHSDANHGKDGYYILLNKLYDTVRHINFDYMIMLADDMRLCENFIDRAVDLFDYNKQRCSNLATCNLSVDERFKACLDEPSYTDGCFIAGSDLFKILGVFRFNGHLLSKTGTGVWREFSRYIKRKGMIEYCPKYSYTFHLGNKESVMLPREREKNNLNTINFIG